MRNDDDDDDAHYPVRNDDIETMSIICRFTCRFRLESGPEIDMLATFDVESTSFRYVVVISFLTGYQLKMSYFTH